MHTSDGTWQIELVSTTLEELIARAQSECPPTAQEVAALAGAALEGWRLERAELEELQTCVAELAGAYDDIVSGIGRLIPWTDEDSEEL